jgi:hypothetical protein
MSRATDQAMLAGVNVAQALRRTGADVSIRPCRAGFRSISPIERPDLEGPLRVQESASGGATDVKTAATQICVPGAAIGQSGSVMKIRFGAIGRHCRQQDRTADKGNSRPVRIAASPAARRRQRSLSTQFITRAGRHYRYFQLPRVRGVAVCPPHAFRAGVWRTTASPADMKPS